jgi:hypothetical protein
VTPAQQALLGYMEGQSEERWSAGWLFDLQTALLGDEGYEWLVEQAGGWFVWNESAVDRDKLGAREVEHVFAGGWERVFVPGTLDELRETAK